MKGSARYMTKKRRQKEIELQAKTDKALCSEVCRAACCSWGFVEMDRDEAERLPRLADELAVERPTIIEYKREVDGLEQDAWVMHATPCTFLSKDKVCRIYKDRPQHCRDFPNTWREWCPLSKRLFHEDGLQRS